jgi:putative DNA primase/helicase
MTGSSTTERGKMTLDLRTGLAREYRREDYITKLSGTWIDPNMPIPLWRTFLGRVTDGDQELESYLQRVAGYCLTGTVRDHVLFFLYGTGANGKGVFLKTLKGIMGDYAVTASMDTFLETKRDRHPTELAFLDGARLVIAQETERGRRWAQAKLQELTGGDDITARYMRQDFFTFRPRFKLIIAGNHKPSLSSIDEAIRRRFHLIPFTVTIPENERDPKLPEKLKAEWPGIMQWAVNGCLKWQKDGLNPPAVIREASEAYFTEEDTLGRWIDERCGVDKIHEERVSYLFDDWKQWSEAAREHTGSQKMFSQNLEKRGFRRSHNELNQATFKGIGLKSRP